MFIVLLGAPGSGKGTVGEILAKDLELAHISTGDLFRENLKNETELGKEAKKYMDKGELVPDEVTIKMLKERLKEKDAAAREFDETKKARYPNVAALTVKMTYDDYLRLLLKWPLELVRQMLAEMNRYQRISEYVDAYRTCIKWLQIEKKRIEKDGRWDIYQKKVEEQKQQVMKFITKK